MNFLFNLTSARTKKQIATLTVIADSREEACDIAEDILLGERQILLVDVGCISQEESYTDLLARKDHENNPH
jgi:hypothetical protein